MISAVDATSSGVRPLERSGGAGTVAIVAAAGALAWLVLFYPGFMSPDSAGHLVEARRGVLSDWHPPIMAALWMVSERVVAGPFGMLVFQTILFWTGLALLASRLPASPGWKVAFLLLVGFAPPVVTIAGAIWKDVLLAAAMVLAFGLAGRSRAFWIAALLATLARHNAIVAVAVAVLLHCAPSGPSIRGLARAVAATVALLVAAQGINAALARERNHTVQMLAMFDMAGVAATTREAPVLHPCVIRRQPLDLDRMLEHYDPRSAVVLVSPGSELHYCFDPEAASALVREWLGTVAAHPGAYLTHRLAVARYLLGLEETPGSFLATRSIYDAADFPDLERPPPQTALAARLESIMVSMTAYGVLQPWIYAILVAVAALVAIRRRLWLPTCIALSGLAHEAGLLVVAPAAEYRYSYWMIVAALIAAAWVVIAKGDARTRGGGG